MKVLVKKLKYGWLISILVLNFTTLWANASPVRFQNGQAIFVLQDHLHHAFYWWPTTLLNYQVQFDGPINSQDFKLVHQEKNQEVPFQFSNARTTADGRYLVTLSFLSDLPSGTTKTFVLEKGNQAFTPITEQQQQETIVIQTSKLTVRIPSSLPAQGNVPGPVIQVSQSGREAMGNSEFNSGTKKLINIQTERLASGPVFTTYQVTYTFSDSATYQATIKCVQDYDFVELVEEMSGIAPKEKVKWSMVWKGFNPTHRQAPNHPFGQPGTITSQGDSPQAQTYGASPGFGRFVWERIDQTKLSFHHGIMPDGEEGKIPFEIGNFEPWPAERTITSTLFWDARGGQSLGVFAEDLSRWDDKDYSIWHSAKLLNVSFYYRNGLLSWDLPLSEGSRSLGLSCYAHQQDIDYMNGLEALNKPQQHPLGFTYKAEISQLSYNAFLQNRFGTIHLDKIKDWTLTYPDSSVAAPVIFKDGKLKSSASFVKDFLSNYYISELPFSGTRQNSGYGPVPARQFTEKWIDGLNRFYPSLTPEERRRVTAMFLFHAYVAADEAYMPMKHMLSGHPNFLADVKSIPALAAFQFPKHPEAENWADLFEKYVDLNTHYHTRPTVEAWNATGGRWTENLGTYVWAFLRPTIRSTFLLNQTEAAKNRMAGSQTASIGNWILNSLSAPYDGESLDFYRNKDGGLDHHFWGIVTQGEGSRRVHPPQGAHSARRKAASSLWMMGTLLDHYDPVLGENLRYVSKPTDDDQEAFANKPEAFRELMYPQEGYDTGTKPDFKSIKLTGYGTILRAGVDTPDELSVHLSQIDPGPNYRWGVPAEGGTGGIYFYAGGKSYSHNGREDVGDRRLQDTDLMTNFGVFKDGHFKSIGQNVLHRPLYDFGVGQFTEITSSETSAYAWPDYQSRSVMLIDKDYFITYDDVYNNNIGGRFSWFTHPDEELPNIEVIRVGTGKGKINKTQLTGAESKGVWYDGMGDFMVFVSHKKGFKVVPTTFGCQIETPSNQTDLIFRSDQEMQARGETYRFLGTAGFIRKHRDGRQEMALFHGKYIGNGDFRVLTSDPDAGVSVSLKDHQEMDGRFYSPTKATITLEWTAAIPPNLKLYIDGRRESFKIEGHGFSVDFPAGPHSWQLTSGLPIPARPQIMASENDHRKVQLMFTEAAGASKYRIEMSLDGCKTWQTVGETAKTTYSLSAPDAHSKVHARIIAFNADHHSESTPAYPVYFLKEKPHFPDGLKLGISNNRVVLSWGQVLGCNTYKLYRRKRGANRFELLYSGSDRHYTDELSEGILYEYAVSAQNKNGQSILSFPVSTDPDSWLQWDPKPGEPFRRTSNGASEADAMYYPE
ncbi:hypothetical protein CLV98_1096 [Dyadobacter jejuensis]|uniref:Fibronectin type-III domain-containing protein n=1 Tax=Dyadobacter jejuensis TaxID=1082580 RepID=A0A316B2X1_9BACT|nr:fibronectin type III domain-containing protein [Dyadobacter jejuensis]PWJ56897.1 hypothetical protein CLV98_1096 [Dyadobacter jejuensis]